MPWHTLPGRYDDHLCPLWVRDGFLDREADWPDRTVILHGHTPTRGDPDLRTNRVGIDTGAYATGPRYTATACGSTSPQATRNVSLRPPA